MIELHQNNELTYEKNQYADANPFINASVSDMPLITNEEIRHLLPRPIFDGHEDYIACYDFAWRIAFKNTLKPEPESGFVSNFIDTAFNG